MDKTTILSLGRPMVPAVTKLLRAHHATGRLGGVLVQRVALFGHPSRRYCAREFVQRGIGKGELAIITEEPVRTLKLLF